MIQTRFDKGEDYKVQPNMDGASFQVSSVDCVVGGVGDEFEINYTNDSLNVSFDAGSVAMIGGNFFKTTSQEAITLNANATIYLCAGIDLSKPDGQTGEFVQRTASNMKSENINGSGSQRDLLLYIITTSASGVVSVQDRRSIVLSSQKFLNYHNSEPTDSEGNEGDFAFIY